MSSGYSEPSVAQRLSLDGLRIRRQQSRQSPQAQTLISYPDQRLDLSTIDLGNASWDGIVSISAHLPPFIRQPLHSRVVAALQKDGILLLEAYIAR